MDQIPRRKFLTLSLTGLAGLALSKPLLSNLVYSTTTDNPLDHYPERDWEKISDAKGS